jgi:uncharacterized coiled-coil DUF342 family protein
LLTIHQETNEIAKIDQKLTTLREQTRKISAETKAYVEKRDKLNEQFRTHRSQIQDLKNQRNSLNEKVKDLKQQRDEARIKIASLIEDINLRRTKIAELKKKKPRKSQQQLEKEFQEIEWTIQTTSLDLEEEKNLIAVVKEIEPQLSIYRKIEKQIGKIASLRKEIEGLEAKADSDHTELMTNAKKSQELHATLLARIEESRIAKTEADNLHNAYVKTREQAKPLYEELKRLSEQRKTLENTLREEDQKKKKTVEKALKEKLENQAKQKLQQGERISWQEFQLLEGDNEPQDSEAQD